MSLDSLTRNASAVPLPTGSADVALANSAATFQLAQRQAAGEGTPLVLIRIPSEVQKAAPPNNPVSGLIDIGQSLLQGRGLPTYGPSPRQRLADALQSMGVPMQSSQGNAVFGLPQSSARDAEISGRIFANAADNAGLYNEPAPEGANAAFRKGMADQRTMNQTLVGAGLLTGVLDILDPISAARSGRSQSAQEGGSPGRQPRWMSPPTPEQLRSAATQNRTIGEKAAELNPSPGGGYRTESALPRQQRGGTQAPSPGTADAGTTGKGTAATTPGRLTQPAPTTGAGQGSQAAAGLAADRSVIRTFVEAVDGGRVGTVPLDRIVETGNRLIATGALPPADVRKLQESLGRAGELVASNDRQQKADIALVDRFVAASDKGKAGDVPLPRIEAAAKRLADAGVIDAESTRNLSERIAVAGQPKPTGNAISQAVKASGSPVEDYARRTGTWDGGNRINPQPEGEAPDVGGRGPASGASRPEGNSSALAPIPGVTGSGSASGATPASPMTPAAGSAAGPFERARQLWQDFQTTLEGDPNLARRQRVVQQQETAGRAKSQPPTYGFVSGPDGVRLRTLDDYEAGQIRKARFDLANIPGKVLQGDFGGAIESWNQGLKAGATAFGAEANAAATYGFTAGPDGVSLRTRDDYRAGQIRKAGNELVSIPGKLGQGDFAGAVNSWNQGVKAGVTAITVDANAAYNAATGRLTNAVTSTPAGSVALELTDVSVGIMKDGVAFGKDLIFNDVTKTAWKVGMSASAVAVIGNVVQGNYQAFLTTDPRSDVPVAARTGNWPRTNVVGAGIDMNNATGSFLPATIGVYAAGPHAKEGIPNYRAGSLSTSGQFTKNPTYLQTNSYSAGEMGGIYTFGSEGLGIYASASIRFGAQTNPPAASLTDSKLGDGKTVSLPAGGALVAAGPAFGLILGARIGDKMPAFRMAVGSSLLSGNTSTGVGGSGSYVSPNYVVFDNPVWKGSKDEKVFSNFLANLQNYIDGLGKPPAPAPAPSPFGPQPPPVP